MEASNLKYPSPVIETVSGYFYITVLSSTVVNKSLHAHPSFLTAQVEVSVREGPIYFQLT